MIDVARAHAATAVGISATMLSSVPRVRSLIGALRAANLPVSPRIFLGGAAFRRAPRLPAELGADGAAFDLRNGVALFEGRGPID